MNVPTLSSSISLCHHTATITLGTVRFSTSFSVSHLAYGCCLVLAAFQCHGAPEKQSWPSSSLTLIILRLVILMRDRETYLYHLCAVCINSSSTWSSFSLPVHSHSHPVFCGWNHCRLNLDQLPSRTRITSNDDSIEERWPKYAPPSIS
jgi:hypothetical protein